MHEEDARKYAPPGWKIYKSRKDNIWRVVHKDLPHVSRCWTLHGETRALAMCLQHAWSFHAKISKESCHLQVDLGAGCLVKFVSCTCQLPHLMHWPATRVAALTSWRVWIMRHKYMTDIIVHQIPSITSCQLHLPISTPDATY